MKICFHFILIFGAIITRLVVNLEKCRKYAFLGGYAQTIKRGGVPFVLRNKWTAPEIAGDHM